MKKLLWLFVGVLGLSSLVVAKLIVLALKVAVTVLVAYAILKLVGA
jgi:hypothetical protein